MKLNAAGKAHALACVASGAVDRDSSWSFSAEDGDKLLGSNNWAEFGNWFLGVDPQEPSDTKAHYRYPFGKDGKVYAQAIRAIRSRSAQQNDSDIFDAAGEILDKINGKSAEPEKTTAVAATESPAHPDVPRLFTSTTDRTIDKETPVYKASTADVNKGTRTISFVASDESVDRYGDIIRVAGWNLEAFLTNPVLLFGHQSSMPPIGRVSDVTVKGTKLIATAEFMPAGMYDFADQIWAMCEAGYLRAVSVGFIATQDPAPIMDKDKWTGGFEFLGQELIELSVVPVPANPNALALAKTFGEGSMRKMFLDFEEHAKQQKTKEEEALREVSRFHFRVQRRLDIVRLGGSGK